MLKKQHQVEKTAAKGRLPATGDGHWVADAAVG
jgi:hypothetical protein